jgi:hypothetical protein
MNRHAEEAIGDACRAGDHRWLSIRLAAMASLWSLVNTRALSVSVAQGAFQFELSWLGILLIVGAMLLWRFLRR